MAPTDAQVRGTQAELPPHWLGAPPPPQVWGDAQVPHIRIPPQPSEILPQAFGEAAQVFLSQAPQR